jgi:hypothetical protein
MDALKCFLFEELEGLIGGDDSLPKGLLEHVVPDHGYDKTSPTFLNFIKYMEEMEKEVYLHHTANVNDFANWVEVVLDDSECAETLRKAATKRSAKTAIIKSLKAYKI